MLPRRLLEDMPQPIPLITDETLLVPGRKYRVEFGSYGAFTEGDFTAVFKYLWRERVEDLYTDVYMVWDIGLKLHCSSFVAYEADDAGNPINSG